MKTLLLHLAAIVAVLMPLQQAQAMKEYGGFKRGLKFNMVVDDIIVAKSVGTKIVKKAAIPKGVPNYKKNKLVKFKIGKKGQLIAKGMNLPFKADGGSANVYSLIRRKGVTQKAYTGEVFKSAENKPTGVALSFVVTKVKGLNTTTTTVTYLLKPKTKKKG